MVQSRTHCEAMVQLACTVTGLISLDTYLGERAAVPVLQCCLATSCTPVSMVAFNKSVHADLGHGYVTTDSIMQHNNEIASNINGSGSKCFLTLIVSDNESKSPETILIKTACGIPQYCF